MSYRTIVVDGHTYKWKVGRKCIEVRSEDRTRPKILVDRPNPQPRWGLITPNMETAGLNIAIFTDKNNCEMAFDRAKDTSSCKDQVELVSLPPKTVPITPGWIQRLIKEKR